jgi:ribosomal protein L37AE/L43A
VSSINSKLGIKPAGARARLNSLSGVACPQCPHTDTVSSLVHKRRLWTCGWCSHSWSPSAEEIAAYNNRVRERDRIVA